MYVSIVTTCKETAVKESMNQGQNTIIIQSTKLKTVWF